MRVRRLLPTALLPLALGVIPASAGPAQLPTGTGGRATSNVTPVAHVGVLGAGVSGAFLGKNTYVLSVADEVWNEVGATAKSLTGGLQVFDTHNPEKPVKVGELSLPNYQNEDISVSVRRHLAVMSQDGSVGSGVNLVDVSNPTKPSLISTTSYPNGVGHTSTLVGNDNYLWVSGGDTVLVVDIRDLKAPKVLGSFTTPAGNPSPGGYVGVHDAMVDQFGDVTVFGGGGTAVYELTKDPLKPKLIAQIDKKDLNGLNDGGLHHGGRRLNKTTWLITDEDYSPGCKDDGAFEVWRLEGHFLKYVSAWDAPVGSDSSGPLTQAEYCSSHWFDVNSSNVVADGWYGAGVRFLDLSNPKKPRPIGIYAGDSTTASQADFVPGRSDLVYVADYVRGLDVVKIANGGKGARTVTESDAKRVGTDEVAVPGLSVSFKLVPDAKWGWGCARPELQPSRVSKHH